MSGILNNIINFFKMILQFFLDLGDHIKNIWGNIKDFFIMLWGHITDFVTHFLNLQLWEQIVYGVGAIILIVVIKIISKKIKLRMYGDQKITTTDLFNGQNGIWFDEIDELKRLRRHVKKDRRIYIKQPNGTGLEKAKSLKAKSKNLKKGIKSIKKQIRVANREEKSGKSRFAFISYYAIITAGIVFGATSINNVASTVKTKYVYKYNNGIYVDTRGRSHVIPKELSSENRVGVLEAAKEWILELEQGDDLLRPGSYLYSQWEASTDNDFRTKRSEWVNWFDPTDPDAPVKFERKKLPHSAALVKPIEDFVKAQLGVTTVPTWMATRPGGQPSVVTQNFLSGAVDFQANSYWTITNNANKLMSENFKEWFDKPATDPNAFICNTDGEVVTTTPAWTAYMEFIKAFNYDELMLQKDWVPKCNTVTGTVDIDSLFDYCVNQKAPFIPDLPGDGGACAGLTVTRPDWSDSTKFPGMNSIAFTQDSIIMDEIVYSYHERITEEYVYVFRQPDEALYDSKNEFYIRDFLEWEKTQPVKNSFTWNNREFTDKEIALAAIQAWLDESISQLFVTRETV